MTTTPPSEVLRGYVPGVFDMFHVGHLNLINSARPFCGHLTVGVVTDEVVEAVKGKPPVVPLRERMEIVAALRDVDDVVIDVHSDKFQSWLDLRYDVIFKGDDWKGTERGIKLEADLAAVGSRVHYFPYTRHTSSTMLRDVLGTLSDEVVFLAGTDLEPHP